MLCFPILLQSEIMGFIYLENNLTAGAFTEDRLEIITILSSQAAISIQNARFYAQLKETERLRYELETAQTVQEFLIPSEDPRLEGIEISSYYQSASETGGDWYSYRHRPENNTLEVLIGDVTGHGVPAALITAMVDSVYNSLEIKRIREQQSVRGDEALGLTDFMEITNEVLLAATNGHYAMTMFYTVLDLENKQLVYSSAGHNPCLVWRPSNFNFTLRGKERKRAIMDLTGWGRRLGYEKGSVYKTDTFQLEKDDIVIWYTDGLIENYNEKREQFTSKRLKKVLKQSEGLSAHEVKELILKNANDHFAGTPFEDDLTLIVGKIK